MQLIIKYRARLTYTFEKYYENELCDIVHVVDSQDDGSWKTISLDWEPVPKIGHRDLMEQLKKEHFQPIKLENHEECPICKNITLPPIKNYSTATGRACATCGAVVNREGIVE